MEHLKTFAIKGGGAHMSFNSYQILFSFLKQLRIIPCRTKTCFALSLSLISNSWGGYKYVGGSLNISFEHLPSVKSKQTHTLIFQKEECTGFVLSRKMMLNRQIEAI